MTDGFLIENLSFGIEDFGPFPGQRALLIQLKNEGISCREPYSVDEFRKFIRSEKTRVAVIYGREPLQNKQLLRVLDVLKFNSFYVICHTSGFGAPVRDIDFIVCLPKKEANPPYSINRELWPKVSEFMYEVDSDFNFTILDRHDVKDGRKYTLWPLTKTAMYSILKYIKENPAWTMSSA